MSEKPLVLVVDDTPHNVKLLADLLQAKGGYRVCTAASGVEALEIVEFAPQRAAAFYKKVLMSAVANAAQDETVNVNRLIVVDARADDGPMLNNRLRWRPGPQGRAMPFAKKTSHLTVVVAELEETEEAGQ